MPDFVAELLGEVTKRFGERPNTKKQRILAPHLAALREYPEEFPRPYVFPPPATPPEERLVFLPQTSSESASPPPVQTPESPAVRPTAARKRKSSDSEESVGINNVTCSRTSKRMKRSTHKSHYGKSIQNISQAVFVIS